MNDKRQNDQLELAFELVEEGEARREGLEGTESLTAKDGNESLAEEQLMEEVLSRENLKKALERVQANKGSPGVDRMSVDRLPGHLRKHWPKLREQLLAGRYRPQPVLRKEIPKQDGGGTRQLGIPTVLDRFIQQALHQVLQEQWDGSFSEHSYGFRPNRNAHQAVAAAQRYIRDGYDWVVDIDLEKFFDRVNHDRLMSQVADRVQDKRVLKLIRAFLNAGVMDAGLVNPTNEGTPQGGPLSPLLSNLVLDELDQELERRGHRFCRYADDCNIYVRSETAGQRVMEGISRFITRKLRLKVNQQKSTVDRPQRRKFLGFRLTSGMLSKRCIAPLSQQRFRARVRSLTSRTTGRSVDDVVKRLNWYLVGWKGYYQFCQTPSVLRRLDSWIRRRLRQLVWVQWKTRRRRYRQLRRLGVSATLAGSTIASVHGPWRISHSPALDTALSDAYFRSLGLVSLTGGSHA